MFANSLGSTSTTLRLELLERGSEGEFSRAKPPFENGQARSAGMRQVTALFAARRHRRCMPKRAFATPRP